MSRKSRTGLTLVSGLVAMALVAACGGDTSDEDTDSGHVRIGASQFAGFSAVLEMADNPVDGQPEVEIVEFGNSAERGTGLLNGDIDMALLGWTQVIQLAAEGRPVVVIASSFERGRTLIAREDSGIASVEDLAGKTVGYSIGSMVDLDINSQLASAGLSLDDLDAVNIGFNDMVLALANGDLDAYYGSEPQSSRTITSGAGYLVQYPYDEPHAVPYGAINGALVTTKDFLDDNPDLVADFLTAYVAVNDEFNSDRDALAARVSLMIGSDDEAVIDATLDNLAITWSLDGYAEKVQALIEAQLTLGFIDQAPDPADFIDEAPLAAVTG